MEPSARNDIGGGLRGRTSLPRRGYVPKHETLDQMLQLRVNARQDSLKPRGFVRMAIIKPTAQPTTGNRKRLSLKIAGIEYRVQWNEAAQAWDVLRNGTATNVSARKKQKSAVDSAIRDAKAELENSTSTVIVTCLKGRKLETLWKGPQSPAKGKNSESTY